MQTRFFHVIKMTVPNCSLLHVIYKGKMTFFLEITIVKETLRMMVLPHQRWRQLALISLVLVLVVSLFALTQQHIRVYARFASSHTAHATTPYHVLFDDAHAETAGNADWIISTSMPDPLQENANPQNETDWTGGLSSWGVALQKTGRYSLMTNTGTLTYGDSSNALDLNNFNALVLPEPNTLFTASEKTAILTFVHNGGGLFMIADHNGSDRNNDGYDSLHIFNDLMDNGGVGNDPFGIQFDVVDIAKDYPSVDTTTPNAILQGPFGTATTSLIAAGTTETINPSDNANVLGVIYTSGSSNTGTSNVFFSQSLYGSGRVIAVGDSSAIDDGTCESGHKCYDGWSDPNAQNNILFPNGTEWLASGGTPATPTATATSPTTTVTATATQPGSTPTNTPTATQPGSTPTDTPTSTGPGASPTPTGTPPSNCDPNDWFCILFG